MSDDSTLLPIIPRLQKEPPRLGRVNLFGLLVATGAFVGFAVLGGGVLEADSRPLNVSVLQGLHAHATPTLNICALGFTYLGGFVGSTVVGCLCVGGLVSRRRFLDAANLAIALLGGLALMTMCKHFFREPRPALFLSIAPESSYSFPSGHSLISVCLYGCLAIYLIAGGPRQAWRWFAAMVLFALAPAIIWSRLYLGVHWPTDVAAGALLAIFWLTCCQFACRAARARFVPNS